MTRAGPTPPACVRARHRLSKQSRGPARAGMGLGQGPEQFLGSSASLLLGMGKPCLAHSLPEHPCACRDGSCCSSGVTGGWRDPHLWVHPQQHQHSDQAPVTCCWSKRGLVPQTQARIICRVTSALHHLAWAGKSPWLRAMAIPALPASVSLTENKGSIIPTLQGRRGHLCQRLKAPRWKVPLAWQRSKRISQHAWVAQDLFHFLGTVRAENSIQLLPCLCHQRPGKINSQSN